MSGWVGEWVGEEWVGGWVSGMGECVSEWVGGWVECSNAGYFPGEWRWCLYRCARGREQCFEQSEAVLSCIRNHLNGLIVADASPASRLTEGSQL